MSEELDLKRSAELLASATPEQVAAILDVDLWRGAAPGLDERFDATRFAEWIEILLDAGEEVAARIVAGLDPALVVAGLSRHIRVFDRAIFEPTAQSDDEPMDRVIAASEDLISEVGGYEVHARRNETWEAIVTLLAALESCHADYFHAVMIGCRRLSNDAPEADGCDDLLRAPDQQLHDVATEREERRGQQGFSTPAAARAFLDMARQPRRRDEAGTPAPTSSTHPIVVAYFRAIDEAETAAAAADPHVRRSQELAFLANTLIAGCGIQSRAFTPQEARDAAVSVCLLGIEHWPTDAPNAAPTAALAAREDVLLHYDLIAAFEIGWRVLYEQVCLSVTDDLIAWATAANVPTLRRELLKHREAGTPWRARDALDELAVRDMPAWVSLLGLIDECPVVAAALTAILDAKTGAISATEFAFISTRGQLTAIRAFMTRLPEILRA